MKYILSYSKSYLTWRGKWKYNLHTDIKSQQSFFPNSSNNMNVRIIVIQCTYLEVHNKNDEFLQMNSRKTLVNLEEFPIVWVEYKCSHFKYKVQNLHNYV